MHSHGPGYFHENRQAAPGAFVHTPTMTLVTAVLILGALAGPAHALTLISQDKTVSIAADWTATGRYRYVFQVDSRVDKSPLLEFIHQVRATQILPESLEIGLDTPGNDCEPWPLAQVESGLDGLAPGSRLALEFEAQTRFQGFEGLVADVFDISQDRPVETATYTISFPGNTDHQVRVEQDGKRFQDCRNQKVFQWSATLVHNLSIMVSTARSWEAVADRYQLLYRERYGSGLTMNELPPHLTGLNGLPERDRLHAALAFLKKDILFQLRTDPDHLLVPDPPSMTLARGWGDCKDLALLGTALLEALDIGARVMLTGTPRRTGWTHELPDPFGFTHALVSVPGNGSDTLFDATTGNPVPAPDTTIPPAFITVSHDHHPVLH